MGIFVLNFHYNTDLGLEENYFVYTLKLNHIGGKFFFSTDMRSLQLIVDLPITNKGAAQGNVLLSGNWGCPPTSTLCTHPLNYSLQKPGMAIMWFAHFLSSVHIL